MANKRLELEQYKHYVDLLQEEPNRRRWRRGIQAALITAMLLALLFFVLGIMSGSLAGNPRNILETPPAPAPEMPGAPGGVTPMSPDAMPGGEVPVMPEQVPAPGPEEMPVPDQGLAPVPGATAMASALRGGGLLAQAQPQDEGRGVPGPELPLDQTAPAGPGAQPAETTGPGEQTTGVGSLSNLANGAGGRGFQLYLLVLFLALLTLLYLPIRRARLETKSK